MKEGERRTCARFADGFSRPRFPLSQKESLNDRSKNPRNQVVEQRLLLQSRWVWKPRREATPSLPLVTMLAPSNPTPNHFDGRQPYPTPSLLRLPLLCILMCCWVHLTRLIATPVPKPVCNPNEPVQPGVALIAAPIDMITLCLEETEGN